MNILFHCFGGINRSAAFFVLGSRRIWLQSWRGYQHFAQEASFPSTVATSRLRCGCIVDGKKRSTPVAVWCRSWHGIAFACSCAVNITVAGCSGIKMMFHIAFLAFEYEAAADKSTETVWDLLMRVLAFDLQLAACRHEIVQKKSTGSVWDLLMQCTLLKRCRQNKDADCSSACRIRGVFFFWGFEVALPF